MTCGRAWCVWWYAGWHCAHPPGSQMCGPCCPVASCPSRRLARWSRWARSSRLSFVRFVPLAFAVRARLVARPLASSSASAPRPRFSARAIASGPISIRRASALFPVCRVRSMYASLRGARARPASLYSLQPLHAHVPIVMYSRGQRVAPIGREFGIQYQIFVS